MAYTQTTLAYVSLVEGARDNADGRAWERHDDEQGQGVRSDGVMNAMRGGEKVTINRNVLEQEQQSG